ncbi:glutathione peroxidase [Gemmatimonas aurantiaca]|nr:glutathione peroxidase [Gemmatimonas aurantiaca]
MLGGCADKQSTSKKSNIEQTEQGEEAVKDTEQQADYRTFGFATIDGAQTSLADYAGQALLIVNVASECGRTPQYAGLQAMYEKYHERGFTILGFPANNFGKQESGSNSEIAEFCAKEYGVTFPMMSKISVKGDDQHPLFSYLTSESDPSGDIDWNFHKFLLDKDGAILARFVSGVKPDDPELIRQIEAAL